jgi:hypothetical protein
MKHVLPLLLMLLLTGNIVAQHVYCDSIYIASVEVDTISELLTFEVMNEADTLIVYPEFVASLDANSYLELDPDPMIITFLDDNNTSTVNFTFTMFSPPGDVPAATTFAGEITMYHPDDPNFACPMNFTFQYGQPITPYVASPNQPGLICYPNPTTGVFNLQVPRTDAPLRIYNQLGELQLSLSEVVNPVDVSQLPAGIYLLYDGQFTSRLLLLPE